MKYMEEILSEIKRLEKELASIIKKKYYMIEQGDIEQVAILLRRVGSHKREIFRLRTLVKKLQ